MNGNSEQGTYERTQNLPIVPCKSVMIFGRDPVVLRRRTALLSGHAQVHSTSTLLALISSAPSPVDLVVLCDTLSNIDREMAEKIIRRQWPNAKIKAIGASPERSGEVLSLGSQDAPWFARLTHER